MSESITVAVRVRPLNSKEKAAKDTEIHKNTATSISISNPEKKDVKSFTFDYVYGTDSTQDNAWAGFNCTLFAYGQTGSGKSYSMTGNLNPPEQKGIIPRGCEEMFNRISSNEDPDSGYEVSYLEMYNEKLQDLLDPKAKKTINIRESTQKGIYIENAIEEPVASYKEIDKLISDGNKVRTVAATAMNATSSRSHAILTIFFTKTEMYMGKKTQRDARVNLVDLAGSERQSKTESTGERLTEACAINKSLSALGNVISALADQSKGKNTFVPYRDSLLTRMLQDSLGGNSKTIMIAAVSPASSNYEETLSTLQYADRAKQIKNKPVVNESETDKLIKQLRDEIERLKQQLAEDSGNASKPGKSSQTGSLIDEGESLEDQQRRADLDKKNAELAQREADRQQQEEAFQKKQAEIEADLERRRNELAEAQDVTAKEEERIANEKEQLIKAKQELEAKGEEANEENQLQIAEIFNRVQELEQQKKALEDKRKQESKLEDELARKQLEIDQLQIQHEQAQTDLALALKQLEDIQLSFEEKQKRSEEVKEKRNGYLKDLGLSIDEAAEASGREQGGPILSNLSLSRDLSGNLLYFLKEGEIEIGSEPPSQEEQQGSAIVLRGLGVEKHHATITYDANAKQVSIYPIGIQGKIVVNGKWVANQEVNEIVSVQLKAGDIIIIGRNNIFRLIFDSQQKIEPRDPEEEFDLLQVCKDILNNSEKAQLAVAHGKCLSVEDYYTKSTTMNWLLHADELIDEANEIARRLGRRINFGLDIQENQVSAKVKVNSHEHAAEWNVSLLEQRLPRMRQMLQDFLNDEYEIQQLDPTREVKAPIPEPDDDPFFNPPDDVLLGLSYVKLHNLLLAGAMRVTLGIREKGETVIRVGNLKLGASLKTRMEIMEQLGYPVNLVYVEGLKQDEELTYPLTEEQKQLEVPLPMRPAQKGEEGISEPKDLSVVEEEEWMEILKAKKEGTEVDTSMIHFDVAQVTQPQTTKLHEVVDVTKIHNLFVIFNIDIRSIHIKDSSHKAANRIRQHSHGIFVRFLVPTETDETIEVVSERIIEKRAKTSRELASGVALDRVFRPGKASFKISYKEFTDSLISKFDKDLIAIEVYGHADSHRLAQEEIEEAELEILRQDLEKKQIEAKKVSENLNSKESEVNRLKKEIADLEAECRRLEALNAKSSSCSIL